MRDQRFPFSDRFQRHLVAVFARVPQYAVRSRPVVKVEWFENELHRAIVAASYAHVDTYKSTPSSATILEGARALVDKDQHEDLAAEIRRVFKEDLSDLDSVDQRIVEFVREAALVEAVLKAVKKIDAGARPGEVQKLVEEAELVGNQFLDVGEDWSASVEERLVRYADRDAHEASLLATGMPHLDEMLLGGLRAGELGVVIAAAKTGKSSLLVNIGYGAVRQGVSVLHVSLELDRTLVLGKYDDRVTGMQRSRALLTPNRYKNRLRSRLRENAKGTLIVRDYGTRTASVPHIRSVALALIARGVKLGLIIVDYLNIVIPTTRRGEPRFEQAGIAEELRALGKQLNVPVWSAAQTNRNALNRALVTLADIGESYEITQVADVNIALCCTPDERAEGVLRIFGAGCRERPTGMTVECRFAPQISTITTVALHGVAYATKHIERDKAASGSSPAKDRVERARSRLGLQKKPSKKLTTRL